MLPVRPQQAQATESIKDGEALPDTGKSLPHPTSALHHPFQKTHTSADMGTLWHHATHGLDHAQTDNILQRT